MGREHIPASRTVSGCTQSYDLRRTATHRFPGYQEKCGSAAKEQLFRSKSGNMIMRALGCFPCLPGRGRSKNHPSDGTVRERRLRTCYLSGRHPQPECRIDTGAQRLGADRPAHRPLFILPVGISGTEALHGLFWFFKRPQITVNFGQPFQFALNEEKLSPGKCHNLYNGTHHRFTAGGIPRSVCGK